jgi:hypothetical protein
MSWRTEIERLTVDVLGMALHLVPREAAATPTIKCVKLILLVYHV